MKAIGVKSLSRKKEMSDGSPPDIVPLIVNQDGIFVRGRFFRPHFQLNLDGRFPNRKILIH